MRASSAKSDRATAYAREVKAGRVVAGLFVRQACERHLLDLKRKDLRWDREKSERAIAIFESCYKLDNGEPFLLQPFQCFIVGSVMGWYGLDGLRRFRTAYVEIGKGNGKTPMAAGLGIIGLVFDEEGAAEVYSAAATQDQASICFKDAKRIVEGSPDLAAMVDVQVGSLFIKDTNSVFRPVSAEHRGLDGKRVHVAIVDELHEHASALVVDKIRAGTKGRRNALIFEITNSGYDRRSVCWAHHEYSRQVLDGSAPNDSWFAYVTGLDAGDQWDDEKVWMKSNPGLGTILPWKYLREQVAEAKGMPSKENIVKRLNFCVWTEQSTRWLPMEEWDRGAREIKREGRCFAGLDLGSTSDFSARCLLWGPDADGEWSAEWRMWIPEARADERIRKGDGWLSQAIADGWLETTPGNVTDYDYIEKAILEDFERYDIEKLAFDRWNASQLITHLLSNLGESRLVKFGQGFVDMSPACRELERRLKGGLIRHGGNPVVRWMASNVSAKSDPAGNIKPDKENSADKIDGIVALLDAIGAETRTADEGSSIYDQTGGAVEAW